MKNRFSRWLPRWPIGFPIGFPIRIVLVIFNLQVTLMLPTRVVQKVLSQIERDAVIYTDQFTCYIGTWTRRLKFVAILNTTLGLI